MSKSGWIVPTSEGISILDLQDKKALITGGTSGMGSAAALALAEKDASVVCDQDVPLRQPAHLTRNARIAHLAGQSLSFVGPRAAGERFGDKGAVRPSPGRQLALRRSASAMSDREALYVEIMKAQGHAWLDEPSAVSSLTRAE